MKAYQLNQISLFSAIAKEISRQCPGIPADGRSNIVIKAADMIVAEYAREPVVAKPSMGLAAWLASDEVGMSSEYMAWVLSKSDPAVWGQRRPKISYPRDADDFGRCVGLVIAMPSYEFLVDEMRDNHGVYWAAVSANWYPWVKLFKARQYKELNQAIRLAYSKADE
ncbi:hypothetical protein EH227_24715 [Rouxiella chamberiensis]|nr:hypothetical protein EH227_24715 [Rouxiella chamberiensis]